MKKIVALVCGILLIILGKAGYAQDINEDKLIQMRDSLDNLLMINPGASAILVKQREIELYSFNSFLSSSQFNDKQGNNSNLPGKYMLFNSLFQVNYGVSKSRRLNVGLDISYRAYGFSQDKNASVFSVLEGGETTVRSLAYVGPRIRVQPFRRINNFTYQTNLWIPVAKDTRQDDLGTSRLNWGHTFFYYKYFNRKIGIFGQANFTFAFPTANSGEGATTEFYIPLSVSLSFVPTPKNIFFGSLSYSWTNYDISKITEGADSDFSQFGIGYQRIITKYFFANISYNGTLFARNYGQWNGFNLGIRFLF